LRNVESSFEELGEAWRLRFAGELDEVCGIFWISADFRFAFIRLYLQQK
jgi:hypothetical protein